MEGTVWPVVDSMVLVPAFIEYSGLDCITTVMVVKVQTDSAMKDSTKLGWVLSDGAWEEVVSEDDISRVAKWGTACSNGGVYGKV